MNEPQLSAEIKKVLKSYLRDIYSKGEDWPLGRKAMTTNATDSIVEIIATALEEQRASMIAEIESWLDVAPAMTLTNPANNHPANAYKLIDKAELRAKLEEMKGEK